MHAATRTLVTRAPLFQPLFIHTDAEQARRFDDRIKTPEKNFKLSPFDLSARSHWVDYCKAKDAMFVHTDTAVPWNVVPSDDKKSAHLNTLSFLLSTIKYEEPPPGDAIVLPPRQPDDPTYARPAPSTQKIIPQVFAAKEVAK